MATTKQDSLAAQLTEAVLAIRECEARIIAIDAELPASGLSVVSIRLEAELTEAEERFRAARDRLTRILADVAGYIGKSCAVELSDGTIVGITPERHEAAPLGPLFVVRLD
jgi:hypothetical protein